MLMLVLLPVLAQYKVGPLDMDVVVMLTALIVFVVSHPFVEILPINRRIFAIIAYIVGVTILNLAFGTKYSENSEIILRMGRYCLYLLIVFFLGNNRVSYTDLMKLYRVIAYAASIYILIQAVFYYGAGIVLPNRIGSASNSAEGEIGRLRAFYSEPAELGYNLLPFIVCSLFGKQYGKRDRSRLDALVATIAVVISTSGQGVICAAVMWAFWVLHTVLKKGMKAKDLLLIVAVAAAAALLYSTGILEFTLERAEGTGSQSAIGARSSGYQTLSLLSPLQLLFGTGFGNYVVENTYELGVLFNYINYSSISEFLFTLGIIGTALWLLFFVFCDIQTFI